MYSSAYVWAKVLSHVEERLSGVTVSAWFDDAEVIELTEEQLILYSPSDFRRDIIRRRAADYIQDALKEIFNSDAKLIVFDDKELEAYRQKDKVKTSMDFNPQFSFENFVVGPSNRFAHGAAIAVSKNPGQVYNPLFIYGESGLGKTHLMHAIANYVSEHNPKKKVLYTTCDKFVTEFIDSLSSQASSARFRQRYRNVDVLMIDDIQFLKDKKSTQEEFFHTFNELSAQSKQIVLTSDKHPQELAILEDRLRTRFAGGMIADIQPPELETKIAILKRKAEDRKCPMIPHDVLEFLARDSGHDVRTLEGRLTKVIFASKLREEPITLALAQTALSESVREADEREELTPERILSTVCHYYKQRKEDVLGKGKKAEVVKARQICAYLMCEMLSLPLVSIGNILGGRDHTTIMYARDKMEKIVNTSDKTAKEVDDIKSILLKQ